MPRYTHTNRSKKLRRESKTLPVKGHKDYGDGIDDGKWFKCWNCGFLCNSEDNELGGPNELNEIKPIAYTQVDDKGVEKFHCEGKAGKTQTICEAAGGTWTSTAYKPGRRAGCPLCGTLNWKGEY